MKAELRPGKDANGKPIVVAWVRMDLGNGPEWVAVGRVR